MIVLS
jgi:hypothetical protein